MKKTQTLLILVALAAMTFLLAGCPKKDKMMGQISQPHSVLQIG